MDLWVKLARVIPSLIHSLNEGEDGALHGAQHRWALCESVARAGTLGRIPGSRAIPAESPCPPAWAQDHPRVTLLFTCLQQTWAVGSGTFGSCSAPCAIQPRVSKGLKASPATSSSSAVELPNLTGLLVPLGHQHWEATLSCPVYRQHSTLRNTPREERGQQSARTPGFGAKLLTANTITTTQTNSTIWLHRGVHLTRIIWSYICVQAFPCSHAQGCFTFIFVLFCSALLGYALPSFTMCHLCRCCSCKVIMAAHQQQVLVTSKRKQRFEQMHA